MQNLVLKVHRRVMGYALSLVVFFWSCLCENMLVLKPVMWEKNYFLLSRVLFD